VTATEEARDLALLAADAASGKLATDIVLIDVSERLAITDVFLIASGSNERQVEAIVDAVEEKLRAAGRKPLRREGRRDGRWVLLDYADIVIHIQHTEERVFYALERLWKDCAMISIDPRGGGSTEWVQPSAARTADRSAAADSGGDAASATAAAADEASALNEDFESDDLGDDDLVDDDLEDDDLVDDDLVALTSADEADLDDDEFGDEAAGGVGSARGSDAGPDVAGSDVDNSDVDGSDDDDPNGVADVELVAEDDPVVSGGADGDTAELGRIGSE
jgi:ribosome-associated protein